MSELERAVLDQAILVSTAFALRDEEALIKHLNLLREKVGKLEGSERATRTTSQLIEALNAVVDRDIEYHGNEICIRTKSHGDAIKLVADARAALAAATGGE